MNDSTRFSTSLHSLEKRGDAVTPSENKNATKCVIQQGASEQTRLRESKACVCVECVETGKQPRGLETTPQEEALEKRRPFPFPFRFLLRSILSL